MESFWSRTHHNGKYYNIVHSSWQEYTEIMKSVATIKLKFNFENERSYNIFECKKPLSFLTIYDLPHSITTYNIVSIEWEKRSNIAVAERKRRYKENITSVVALEHDAFYMNMYDIKYLHNIDVKMYITLIKH